MQKFLSLLLVLTLLLALGLPGMAAQDSDSGDIAILYTNDIHTYLDKPLTYGVLRHIKDDLMESYNGRVLLLDGGDHIQGTAYGSMDQGEHAIMLMNAAGYDAATLGNHEFDYGMEGNRKVLSMAEFTYLDCNFYHEKDGVRGENVLPGYKIFDLGGTKLAVVGVLTPETFTKSTPSYFQDENGNYIYGISGGDQGQDLAADVQKAIDSAREEGADLVIGLGHMGVDEASRPWTSWEMIHQISSMAAFVDGHSHTEMEKETVIDAQGNPVVLTQTGCYFDAIGLMLIHEDGTIDTDLIHAQEIREPVLDENGQVKKDKHGEDLTEVVGYTLSSDLYDGEFAADPEVQALQDQWVEEIQSELGVVIGTSQVALDNMENGKRLVRSQETNTGDFTADALYYLFDSMDLPVDVAMMNGGGIRNQRPLEGEMSYLTMKEIHTFGNVACLDTVTGQQLLDALEWGARKTGSGEECGGFMQVSGLTYRINTAIPNTTQADDKGVWIGGPTGEYRVHDVKVYNRETDQWDPLDPEKSYNVAGYHYTLRKMGDGFNMFAGSQNIRDYVMEDYMILSEYLKAFPGGVMTADNSPLMAKYPGLKVDYSTVHGSGRIKVENAEPVSEETAAETAVPEETIAPTEAPQPTEPARSFGMGDAAVIILVCAGLGVVIGLVIYRRRKHA